MITHDYVKECTRLTRDNLLLRRALLESVKAIPNNDLDPCKLLPKEACPKVIDEEYDNCDSCRFEYFVSVIKNPPAKVTVYKGNVKT